MDPNALSNLDPKLRETYERVMGTTPQSSTSQPAATPNATPNPTQPAAQPTSNPAAPAETTAAAPAQTAPPMDNIPPGEGLSAPVQQAAPVSEQPQNVTINQPLPDPTASVIINKPHGHTGLIRTFYVLGATVFFIIYALFWMKIFNIKLPFLP